MKIIYLPGKSLKNKDEGDVITSFLKQHGYEIYFHQWNHWANPENELDIDQEVNLILENTKNFLNDEITLIAKSFGSFVAVKLVKSGKFNISKIIFLGIPVNDFDDKKELQEYPETLKTFEHPIYVIQNSEDPHGKPEDVEDLLSEVKFELIEKDGTDHKYYYTDEVFQCLREDVPSKDMNI